MSLAEKPLKRFDVSQHVEPPKVTFHSNQTVRFPISSVVKSTRLFIFTLAAMIAFASNSLLCRAALKQTRIDAATFTFVRIFFGAAALWVIMNARNWLMVDRTPSPSVISFPNSSPVTRHSALQYGNWISALVLFVYAAAFSFSYVNLSAGTGALLLFGAVQATMILWGLHKGERLDAIQIAGFILAVTGLVVLVFPGLSAPPLIGSILMLGAGVAWGIYSLRGKGEEKPASATTGNFIRAVPFAVALGIIFVPWAHVDLAGITFGIISGAITSGLGYVIWYSALPGLKAASAATVQLSVPVLAATGGILLLGEPITLRYLLASVAVLGGIALVVVTLHSQDQTASRTEKSRS
jgi:drug/metabolite transporter (DMT)-like permease